ncbi:uncharacterized protein MONOS_13784 [Monocercomonoides exilis]|uniref:uncharacterized protein n=1 Tax=Monocercomonoides exilis TaxID=2049356 RepID=UPI0035599C3D|nr:hypothetical protein MONOS_13784 [Monocercomonoides exilis]|eukprot:MONOS_13784.1-p1 / transcript=MONOS_13784.1 / gene=MONOS_13784 / organism=Monocercomonoides_exilis_PA203 / gene_product=unspecified product / transcript_product=unspecified product / location=Mono_scaffold00882:24152-24697(-) / protein_length=182 / sequence_SO=supercontig / SO=protein_coding / is_pseudo=false
MGTGLATEPCSAPLTGGPPSAIPSITGSYSASQSSVQSSLDSRTDLPQTEEVEGDSSLQQAFMEIFGQALKEARHVRIQARYGFSEAEKMKDEFSSSLLTQRQKDILEESKKTSSKLRWGSASIANTYARKKQTRGFQSGSKNYRFFRDWPRTTSAKRSFITSSAPRGYSRGSSGDKAKSQ